MAQLVIENLQKNFAQRPALRQINLRVNDGEFLVLVGPSGCGKSTLLRLIAGLETADAGQIWVGSRLVNQLPPKSRDIAMVFQSYALYPHLSVYDNIAFGLRRSSAIPKAGLPIWLDNLLVEATRSWLWQYVSDRERTIAAKVQQVAELLQLTSLLARLPKQLSGGQRQRVALGRAIARNPQVFLLDEPLSNLDAKLRTETRGQIVQLQRQLGVTTIYVTHDQVEAMTMGDRIAVMQGGQIEQIASPMELYQRPVNQFVAEFIGSPPMNFIPVRVEAITPITQLTHPKFQLSLAWGQTLAPYLGRSITLGIRPEHLSFASKAAGAIPITVELVEFLGHEIYLLGRLDEQHTIQLRLPPSQTVNRGDRLLLQVEQIYLFDPQTGQAIYQPNT